MIGYGFGYDEEVPGGFQDADLEMAELEERAREERECQGHPAGEFDPQGQTVYCDGSCRNFNREGGE